MANRRILTPEVLRQLLRYEADTGRLFWLERGPEWFTNGRFMADACARRWNTRYAGREAFTQVTCYGYRAGSVLDFKVLAHRVAFSMSYGVPLIAIDQIDHINGDKADNRISNLRAVTASENQKNKKLCKGNRSGVPGVHWQSDRKRWLATITSEGKQKNLGRFRCFCAAVNTRKLAELRFGFHPNHGRIV